MNKFLQSLFFITCMHTANVVADITKVIVPMAGLGTRLLPLTEAWFKKHGTFN